MAIRPPIALKRNKLRINNNKVTVLIPLDPSPACDTVDRGIVNNILKKWVSISGVVLH